jgi:hypothetical protein
LTRQSYALTILGTDLGVDPQAIEDMQVTLLRHHKITSSQYSVQPFRQIDARSVGNDVWDRLCSYVPFDGVVAHLLNKPVLAIAHHPKVTDLMAEKLWREQNERWPSKAKAGAT